MNRAKTPHSTARVNLSSRFMRRQAIVSASVSVTPSAFIELSPKACYVDCGRVARVLRGPEPEDNELSLSTPATPVATDAAAAIPGQDMTTSDRMLETILSSLSDDKAEDIVQISLRGKSEMADHMVIASGRSTRQVAAMSEKLVERVKATFGTTAKVEGKEVADWVLIDTGDVIVHLFRPEVREFYQLEKMWMSGAEASRAP